MFPAGIAEEAHVFLVNDNQITNEMFLEDINNVLNSGEVANLWDVDEKQRINDELRAVAAEKGIYEGIYKFFV